MVKCFKSFYFRVSINGGDKTMKSSTDKKVEENSKFTLQPNHKNDQSPKLFLLF